MWGKYGRGRNATGNTKIRPVRIACWITKAINTHSEYVILFAVPRQYGCTNAPQCYIVPTLSVLCLASVPPPQARARRVSTNKQQKLIDV